MNKFEFEEGTFVANDSSTGEVWIDTAANELCICTGDEVLRLSRDGQSKEVSKFIEFVLAKNAQAKFEEITDDPKLAKKLTELTFEMHAQTRKQMESLSDD